MPIKVRFEDEEERDRKSRYFREMVAHPPTPAQIRYMRRYRPEDYERYKKWKKDYRRYRILAGERMPEQMVNFYMRRKISSWKMRRLRARFKDALRAAGPDRAAVLLRQMNDYYFYRQYEIEEGIYNAWSPLARDLEYMEEIWELAQEGRLRVGP